MACWLEKPVYVYMCVHYICARVCVCVCVCMLVHADDVYYYGQGVEHDGMLVGEACVYVCVYICIYVCVYI